MNQFWVLVVGVGEGCDHSIGCNKNWMRLEGCVDMAGAQEMVKLMLAPAKDLEDSSEFLCGLDKVQSILILEVEKSQPVSISDLKEFKRHVDKHDEEKEAEEKELAELARLKQKYPDV